MTQSISLTFWIAVFINMIAFFLVLLLNFIDKRNSERRLKLKFFKKQFQVQKRLQQHLNCDSNSSSDSGQRKEFSFQDQSEIQKKVDKTIWHKIQVKKKIRFSDIMKFEKAFWFICILAFIEKVTLYPFIQNASEMFQLKFNLDLQETGTVIAIPFIVFIFLGPLLGILLDKIGMRCYILIIGYFCVFISYYVFFKLDICPEFDKCYQGIFPMSLIGIASTIIQLTMYVCVNYIIKEKHYGTAYGILQAVGNLGLTLGSLLIGGILD